MVKVERGGVAATVGWRGSRWSGEGWWPRQDDAVEVERGGVATTVGLVRVGLDMATGSWHGRSTIAGVVGGRYEVFFKKKNNISRSSVVR